ncbi:HIT family protein [Stieleria sp. JC731]|uniref:HIT family protein n=1 Tax=Pirellulaceae TaxID=2691357 RepID=UPI001E4AF38A|nr:HIT family protein [Stieleria sp. JC731]MCC9602883.1 HIT family protein [Stieleria sp. JC731]
MKQDCPFCKPIDVWLETDNAMVLWDGYPVSEGHSLVVPRQHVASVYDLPSNTLAELWQLVAETRKQLEETFHPDGFNIGLNDGEAAGQTVMHAHIHVIPRWKDDVSDPRGGVRWIIPEKARYWGDE